MQVDAGAEQSHRHGAALDVPAGAARPERRVPRRLVGCRRLPQHEVQRVALAVVVGGAAPLGGQGAHGVVVVAAEPAEAGPCGHVEPGGALDGVGVARRDEILDERHHLGHPFGGSWLGLGGTGVEVLHVAVEPGHLGRGQLQEVHAELAGLGQDRVVDVGDVAHHPHAVAEVLEAADQQVVGQVGVGVAEVGAVIGGDPAHVDPHLRGRRGRLEGHHGPPRGVVQAHGSEATAHPEAALAAGRCPTGLALTELDAGDPGCGPAPADRPVRGAVGPLRADRGPLPSGRPDDRCAHALGTGLVVEPLSIHARCEVRLWRADQRRHGHTRPCRHGGSRPTQTGGREAGPPLPAVGVAQSLGARGPSRTAGPTPYRPVRDFRSPLMTEGGTLTACCTTSLLVIGFRSWTRRSRQR